MADQKTSKLTGEVLSITVDEKSYDDRYWLDVALRLADRHIVNVRYTFGRSTVRDNLLKIIKKGMSMTAPVSGQVDLDQKFDYVGLGAPRLHDRTAELEKVVGREFNGEREDYFIDGEVALIKDLLAQAKYKIKEVFEPNPQEMEKVEEHLESLARKTESVTKYDWKRLFIRCGVGISVDLGFGTTVPEAIYNLFKNLIKELIEYRLTYKPSPVGIDRE